MPRPNRTKKRYRCKRNGQYSDGIPLLILSILTELQYWNALKQYITESARLNRELDDQRLNEDSRRYGQAFGGIFTDIWEDGESVKSIGRRQVETQCEIIILNKNFARGRVDNACFSILSFSQAELSEMKDELEKKKKALRKRPTSISEASGNTAERGDCDSIECTEEFLKVR